MKESQGEINKETHSVVNNDQKSKEECKNATVNYYDDEL